MNSPLEQKSMRELKEIAALYGLSQWDLHGNIRLKSSWINAIRSAQNLGDGFISDPEKASLRLYEWMFIEASPTQPIFVNPSDFQRQLKIDKPAFWYALYSLREKKEIEFSEPTILEFSRMAK